MNLILIRVIDILIGIPVAYLVCGISRICSLFQKNNDYSDVRSILIIKFWGIGNALMLFPAVKALRKQYPHARIDFLTLILNKDVAQAAGVFDAIYCISIAAWHAFIPSLVKQLCILRKNRYDVVVDFEQFARFSALLTFFIGKKKRIGFDTEGQHRAFLFTDPVPYNNSVHITRSFFYLVERLEVPPCELPEPVALFSSETAYTAIRHKLSEHHINEDKIIVVMHVGTSKNFQLRRWPPEYFAQLADILITNHNVAVVFTGLNDERAYVAQVPGRMTRKEDTADLSGALTFEEFIALLKRADLIVSADTAPVHFASALSRPVVGLYGPNTPALYGPWNTNGRVYYKQLACSPCITNYNAKINKCRHPQGAGACMRGLSVQEVYDGIVKTYFADNAPCKLERLTRNA